MLALPILEMGQGGIFGECNRMMREHATMPKFNFIAAVVPKL